VISQATRDKFKYPHSLVKEYEQWEIYLRHNHVTLGSLVLICKSGETSFHQISEVAFAELKQITTEIESTLKSLWDYDKINYLMLMMGDPEVHFHVIPRYKEPREFEGIQIVDKGWPKTPDLLEPYTLSDEQFIQLRDHLKKHWKTA
jgi:diadenosine tetraphosphate (Ap4A) HIT family hydrolase